MNITGIILAGGKSSRMGTDKGLLDFEGQSLIEYAISVIRPICNEILISTNQKGYEGYGFPIITDNFTDCGPIGGLEAALKASKTDWNVVISCDTPSLKVELFQEMIAQIKDQDVLIPSHENGIEPLAGIYHKRMSSTFKQKIDAKEYKLRKIIKACKIEFFDSSPLLAQYPKLFVNLNSQDDLNREL